MVNKTIDTTNISNYSEIPPFVYPLPIVAGIANLTIAVPDADITNVATNTFIDGIITNNGAINIQSTMNTLIDTGFEPESEISTSCDSTALYSGSGGTCGSIILCSGSGSIGDVSPSTTITIQPSGTLNIHGLELRGDTPITPRTRMFLMSKGANVEQYDGSFSLTCNNGFNISKQDVEQFLASRDTTETKPEATQNTSSTLTCRP